MLTFLLILIIIACILLIFIILAQNPKGGSGLSNFGAGASQFLGARQTADFLEKSTWYFGIGILVVIIFSYFLISPGDATQKFKTEGVDYSPTNMQQPSNSPQQGNPLDPFGQQGEQPTQQQPQQQPTPEQVPQTPNE